MTSTMVAPALKDIAKELHIQSDTEMELVMSAYVLSYVFVSTCAQFPRLHYSTLTAKHLYPCHC